MEITLLILIHLIYLGRFLDCLLENRASIVFSSALLTLLCWQRETVFGIVTLCYTVIIFIILLLFKE